MKQGNHWMNCIGANKVKDARLFIILRFSFVFDFSCGSGWFAIFSDKYSC
jgi:hypothetical protein